MTKVMKCGDLMSGCDFEARGETEAQILQAAAAHAKEAHNLEATPELVEQVIRDQGRVNRRRARGIPSAGPLSRRRTSARWIRTPELSGPSAGHAILTRRSS